MLSRRFLVALFLVAGMLGSPLANAMQAVRAQRRGDVARTPATLGGSRSKRPRPRNPRPPLWQLRRALRAPQEPENPNAPVVDVAAEAALTLPGAGDLDPTIDVQITPEIIDKAVELGSVQAMYEFVRNDCAFQTYYGSQKGSVETLRQRAGNDYDLASLLIALLRASGIPARYADGIVEMPVDRVTSWLGVDDGQVAGSILFTTGMEGVSIIDGQSNVVAVRCRRVWVEAFVPSGFGSPTWRPLDPSFAETSLDAGVDIPEAMMLDALGFVDEYWDPTDGSALPRPETILELLKQDVQDYLDVNLPGTTVNQAMRKHEIVPQRLGLLPGSLPYTVRSRDSVYSEIPADRRYQIRFHLHDGGTNLIDHTVNLPELAGRRVTVDYQGATPADEAILDANGGIYATVPSTVDLTPVLRIDGSVAATGAAGVGMGLSHSSDVHFLAPVNQQGLPQNVVPAIFNSIVCGASQAIGIAVEGIAEGLLTPPPADDTEGTLSLLYDTAMDYMANVRNDEFALGRIMHGYVTTGITSAIVDNVVKVTFDGFGVPQTFDWVGLRVDADRSIIGFWRVESFDINDPEPRDFLIIAGAGGSLWENQIFENSYGQDSISTIKILELAIDAGVTVYKRWNTLPLPPNTQPAFVQNSIANAIAIGHEVTFPADPMTVGSPATGEWTGTAWIDMDPANGAAGYLISGANNGGATVETWPPTFIDLSQDDKTIQEVEIEITTPADDSPACDAVFTRDNEENLTFEYLVHVTYDDASTNTVGPYQRVTRNTTKTFFPGNYTFKVWISRRVWWFFNSTIAEAERQLSIVGVLIRLDDGSDIGKTPPKFLPVELAAGPPQPFETIKALVIPEEAPDGSPIATAYSWTGGAKLMFDPANAQSVDIKPASPDPSAALEDQEVNVTVSLICGKQEEGYREFNFAPGGTDVEHKMTVYKVTLKTEDESDDAPEYVAINGQQEVKAILEPDGVEGEFKDWTTTSTKVTLSYPFWGLFGQEVVRVDGGMDPSTAVEDEEITPMFQPECSDKEHPSDPHKMTVVEVFFRRDPGQNYGYDEWVSGQTAGMISDDPHWISVRDGGNATTAIANTKPTGVDAAKAKIHFESDNTSRATVLPVTATAFPQTITITGVAAGFFSNSTDLFANVGKPGETAPEGDEAGKLQVAVYDQETVAVGVWIVDEDNDDVQTIPPTQGQPNQTSVRTGANGVCNTASGGDDSQLIPVGNGAPMTTAITAGVDGILQSTAGGDDTVAGTTITTGPDGVCNTAAAGDDAQVLGVGNGAANSVAVNTGADGVSQSPAGGDDAQNIPVGQGQPNITCITDGVNTFRDSVPAMGSDDVVVGNNIATGPDGICDTTALSMDTVIVGGGGITSAGQTAIYKQAVVNMVVTNNGTVSMNYDLNRDGMFFDPCDVSTSNEGNLIHAALMDPAMDKHVYFVLGFQIAPGAIAILNGDRCFYGMGAGCPNQQTIAHELGHCLGYSHSSDPANGVYAGRLMYNFCAVANNLLIKTEWDALH